MSSPFQYHSVSFAPVSFIATLNRSSSAFSLSIFFFIPSYSVHVAREFFFALSQGLSFSSFSWPFFSSLANAMIIKMASCKGILFIFLGYISKTCQIVLLAILSANNQTTFGIQQRFAFILMYICGIRNIIDVGNERFHGHTTSYTTCSWSIETELFETKKKKVHITSALSQGDKMVTGDVIDGGKTWETDHVLLWLVKKFFVFLFIYENMIVTSWKRHKPKHICHNVKCAQCSCHNQGQHNKNEAGSINKNIYL